jgi:deoxyribonuclease-4
MRPEGDGEASAGGAAGQALLLGSHMSIAKGYDQAAREAAALGFNTVQVFTKSSNQWAARAFRPGEAEAFRAAVAEAGLARPVAHDSYLINLGSPEETLWRRSIDALAVELERAEALGIGDLVVHPGAHVGSGEEAGLARIAAGLDEVHRLTRGLSARIALETTAGQGSTLGHRFEHLGWLLAHVAESARLGVCVDTCHIFAAGYSLENEQQYNDTMDELDRAVGLGRVRVWHLNDSVRERGSRVDRHAGLGRGRIGLAAFGLVLNDPRFSGCPMILETPKGDEDGQPLDAINLSILKGLRAGNRATRRGGKA